MTDNTQIFIEFNVEKFFIKNVSKTAIPCSNKNYIFAHFKFSQEWDNVDKTAVFTKDDIVCHIPIVDNKCAIPNELMRTPGNIEVSVFGGDRIATGNTVLKVIESGFHDESEPPVPLDPTAVWVKSPDGSVSLVREVDGVFQYFSGDEWKNITSCDGFDPAELDRIAANEVSQAIEAHNASPSAHQDIRSSISGLENRIDNISINGGGVVSGNIPTSTYISGLTLAKVGYDSFSVKAGGCWDDTYTRFLKLNIDIVKNTQTWQQGTNAGGSNNPNAITALIPQMTGNTKPSGSVEYTGYVNGSTQSTDVYKAFTNVSGSGEGANLKPYGSTFLELIYNFPDSVVPGAFSVTGGVFRTNSTVAPEYSYIVFSVKRALDDVWVDVGTLTSNLNSDWNQAYSYTIPQVDIDFEFNAYRVKYKCTSSTRSAHYQRHQISRLVSLTRENVYLIGKEDGTTDIAFTHETEFTLPVGYIYKRNIGTVNFVSNSITTVFPEADLQELHFSWPSVVPDLAAGRAIESFPYTTPDNGWLYSYVYADNGAGIPKNAVFVDGKEVHAITSSASGIGTTDWIAVSKGSVLTATNPANVKCSLYLPKRS